MSNLTPRINRLEPNIIINGGMELAQRFNGTGGLSNAYAMDRFYVNNQNVSMTTLVDQSSAVPSNMGLMFSQRVYNTTTGSLAANTRVDCRYRVEGYDVLPLVTGEWSAIFWVRSSVAGVYSLTAKNSGATHSYVRQYTISAANTWQLVVLKFPALSTCPGTINRTNGIGVELKWSIVNGTTYQTTPNAWQTGDFDAGPGQVTSWLTSGNEFLLTGIMVLPGDYEALLSANYQFVRCGRNFSDEFQKAQRYYEKTWDLGVAVGTTTSTGAVFVFKSAANTSFRGGVKYAARKRATPTIVAYSTTSGTANTVRNTTTAADETAAYSAVGETGYFQDRTGGADANNNILNWHYTADAEL